MLFLFLLCFYGLTLTIAQSEVTATENSPVHFQPDLSNAFGRSFDWPTANVSVWLSATAYCDPSSYMNYTYTGPAEGFVPTLRVDNKNAPHSVHGFIGYLPLAKQIYVVFQGTTYLEQWMTDAMIAKTSYFWCKEDYDKIHIKNPCEVHKGFYSAQRGVSDAVVQEVTRLHGMFPHYEVIITGHSLGGALATLQSVDVLKKCGIQPRLFTFGAPRQFNNQASSWVTDYITDKNRFTHRQDPIPHIPGPKLPVYRHIAGEWYEPDQYGKLEVIECTGFEDGKCAGRWDKWQTILIDHHTYLHIPMDCGLKK